jgi:hypothetical protein
MGPEQRAYVSFLPGFEGHQPAVVVRITGTGRRLEKDFGNLAEAIAWARGRASRVEILVAADKSLSAGEGPIESLARFDGPEGDALRDAWRREQQRCAAEYRTAYADPRRWYVTIVNPDIDGDADAALAAVEAQPEIVGVARGRLSTETPVWTVTVMARSIDEARSIANLAVMRVLWPDQRVADSYPGSATYVVSVGENQWCGLVEHRNSRFSSPPVETP